MLEELCKRNQHCWATLRRSRNKRNVGNCLLKSLTSFRLRATTCNRVCKRTSHCLRARRPIRPALISGFRSMKRLGVFILPPGWDVSPSQGYPQHYAGTHLYTWVERSTMRVKCLAQEHNTMSPARPRTRTTRSGVERTNHEATAPPCKRTCNTQNVASV